MVSNKNILIAQGGGPTNVINQSLVGIIRQEKKYKSKILGSINGVNGIINNRFISLNKISENDLKTIANTPGAALGSTRDKPDKKYCKEILKILENKQISKFYYIGGNDSSVTSRIRMKMLADSTRWTPSESIMLTTRMHEHEPIVSGEMTISNVHSVTGPEVTP